RIYYPKEGLGVPRIKTFLKEEQYYFADSIMRGVGTSSTAKDEIQAIFDDREKFDTPKPHKLLQELIRISTNKDSIILDSFAGSGTTAHAVLSLNKEDGGNRKFILIEMLDYAENITAERVKRVAKGYKDVEGLGGEFDYYELGQNLFDEDNNLNEQVEEEKIRQYIYYSETKQPLTRQRKNGEYLLDNYNETGYYFYYEKDKLTNLGIETLNIITEKQEQYIVYADTCSLSKYLMKKHNIIFKKIPRDIRRF
ncbi:MAG: DNA methyltransferase, partial [Bacteroidota bacterium]|nr:DNA methyltransferase [Bacteroidota bacterium]